MARHKKVQVDDETLDEEMESELPSGAEEAPGMASDVPADFDDLIGEPESSELEPPEQPGSDTDATGEIESDNKENTQKAPIGWLSIDTAPRSGTRVMLSDDGTFLLKAFWHRTRRFEKGRWQFNGKWRDAVTGKDRDNEPRFWRELKPGE